MNQPKSLNSRRCQWAVCVCGTPTKRQPHVTLDPPPPPTSHRLLSRAFLPTRLHCSPLPTVTLSRTGTRPAPEHNGLFWGVEGADLLGERRLFSQEKESARPRLAGGFLSPGEQSPPEAELECSLFYGEILPPPRIPPS